ncbi:MAG: hypothetical protein HC816_12420 [Leptolyngbyaceae cyanobacterium RM1_1_2]|nr:hypothetical protein [Leptolyngbyaceae cyanobacterium RM1_1_2]
MTLPRVPMSNPSQPLPPNCIPFGAGETDPVLTGSDYLQQLRQVAIASDMIQLPESISQRLQINRWIGLHVESVNAQLRQYLSNCQHCFKPHQQVPAQVLAAPLSERYGIDAVCNLQTTPVTLLIDVGQIEPSDWQMAITHEYAHAQVGSPGHAEPFRQILHHLCLGLALPVPAATLTAQQLSSWPACRHRADKFAFWEGKL